MTKISHEKKIKYNKNIHTPELGAREFYSQSQQGNHGKLEFLSFVKALEIICAKIYPESSLEFSLNQIWDFHLSLLLKTLEKNKIDERTIGTNKIEILAELLQNKEIVKFIKLDVL